MAKEVVKKEEDISQDAVAYKALIEAYKVKNPAKYEKKKAVLEAKLAAL